MKVMKLTVFMVLACLFCLLKIERNNDGRQANIFVFYIYFCYIRAIKHGRLSDCRELFLGTASSSLKSCSSYEILRQKELTVVLYSLYNVFYLVLFTSFSDNYPSLSLIFLSFAKHNLYLYRDNCFRDQHFPNGDAGKCIVQQTLRIAGSGLEAGQELLRGFWLEDRVGCSDRTEIPIQDVKSQAVIAAVPSKSGCCPSLAMPGVFTLALATSSQLHLALHFPCNPVILPKILGGQLQSKNLWCRIYSQRSTRREKRKFDNCYFLHLHKIAGHTYTQAQVF